MQTDRCFTIERGQPLAIGIGAFLADLDHARQGRAAAGLCRKDDSIGGEARQVARGAINMDDTVLAADDGAAIVNEDRVSNSCDADSDILQFDML
jgi:hypothetical protein